MSALPRHTMTADEFLAWDARQPRERGRFELIEGHVIKAQYERVEHLLAKKGVIDALDAAIRRAGLACTALPDGATVRISPRKIYKADGLVVCGPLDPRAVEVPDPIIVVEVLCEDSADRDHGEKLVGYFSLPGVQHYLIVDPVRRLLIHHRRSAGDDLLTRVRKTGRFTLDPPGLEIDLGDVFAAVERKPDDA